MGRELAATVCVWTKWEKSFVQVTLDNVSSCQCQLLCMSVLIPVQIQVYVCVCVKWQFAWCTKSKKIHLHSERISGRSPERAACGWLDRSFDNRLPRSPVISQQALWIYLEEGKLEYWYCLCCSLHFFLSLMHAASAHTETECWCDLTGTQPLKSVTWITCCIFTVLPGDLPQFDA